MESTRWLARTARRPKTGADAALASGNPAARRAGRLLRPGRHCTDLPSVAGEKGPASDPKAKGLESERPEEKEGRAATLPP